MTSDPIQLDTATHIGAWLATYWLHAAVAIGTTWVLARTVLRDAPAGLRAFAWRAAIVAPLLTSAVRCGLVTDGHQLEMAWLGRTADIAADVASETGDASQQAAAADRRIEVAARHTEPSPPTFAGTRGSDQRDAGAAVGRPGGTAGPARARTTERAPGQAPMRTAARTRDALIARNPESNAAKSPVAHALAPPIAPPVAIVENPASPAAGATESTSFVATLLRSWSTVDPRRLALLVAAVAALLALARWLDGWLRLGRQLGHTRPLDPERAERAAHLARVMGVAHTRIAESDRVRVPMAYGFATPRICLPTEFHLGLTAAEWDAAVAHELAHVVRGDQRWLPTLRLVARVFAFQPLNKLAWRELQRDSEHAADETAVRVTGAAAPLALCLAKVATRVRNGGGPLPAAAVTGAPTMAGRMSLVVERADRILGSAGLPPRRARSVTRLAAIAPTVVVALALPRLAPAVAFGQTLVAPDAVATVLDDAARRDLRLDDANSGARPSGFELASDRSPSTADRATSTHSAPTGQAPTPPTAAVLLATESTALGHELEAARDELQRAFEDANSTDRDRLVTVLGRLERLEEQHRLLARLIHERDDPAKSSSLAPSPDLHPERDIQR